MTDIIIYGRGKTGQSLRKMLQRLGKTAIFYDDKQGFDGDGGFSENSFVLLSPGVKPSSNGVSIATQAGAKLVSELEYCFPLCQGRCISVTGTNGKTTTCEMIFHLLKSASMPCRLLGNGGTPISAEVLDVEKEEYVVLESSSFQLMNSTHFAPYISVFTNLACDHLDYHGSYEDYVLAKVNNFVHQIDGYAIFNADDENVVELSHQCKCKRLYYSTTDSTANCYIDGEQAVVNVDGVTSAAHLESLQKYAKHNLSNALAALLAAYVVGIPLDKAIDMLSAYRLLPHRLQFVAALNGVTFVDDSKGTNVHATVSAINNYAQQNLALILGGSDKGEQFDDIFVNLGSNVIAVTASGDTAERIASCGKKYGVDVEVFDDIQQATSHCYKALLSTGGVVLMSNACASFDKFGGYAERGDYFQQVVKGLSSGKKTD